MNQQNSALAGDRKAIQDGALRLVCSTDTGILPNKVWLPPDELSVHTSWMINGYLQVVSYSFYPSSSKHKVVFVYNKDRLTDQVFSNNEVRLTL